uniref:NADH-ubiquinone oxidoreductase chain 6 n=1 Tax=Parapsyche difformis TaxID=2904886 RepID=A0A9E8LNL9_9NEOP|nr:NADH dehydrogenase subunit 6 [Parapsyche difformis]UZZ43685.1 NADH dehydrogenase subunit 6 [Parapsyche difformis]
MMKLTILSFMVMNSLFMLTFKTPLSLGVFLMMQTLLSCMVINSFLSLYWISYIFYLIMLGGLLILFMYMCSLASNEVFNLNFKYWLYFLILTMMTYFIIMFMNKLLIINIPTQSFQSQELILINENKFVVNKMYNLYTMNLTMMLIIYLLISLSLVTKLTNSNSGPLRTNI